MPPIPLRPRFICIATLFSSLLLSAGLAWSQPGTVLSMQKISNTQGNFSATLHNVDEFGGASAWLGETG